MIDTRDMSRAFRYAIHYVNACIVGMHVPITCIYNVYYT